MKKKIKIIILIVVTIGITMPEYSYTQGWGRNKGKSGIWDSWSLNINGGVTSFFGDLSRYDSDLMEKLTKESGLALSGILTKKIANNKFGVSGQLLYGSLKGENLSKVSFEATFIEYNLHARLNFINLFSPDNILKFGISGYAGIGQFIFNSTRWDRGTGDPEISVENTGTPEFVYFAGIGAYYDITEKFGVTAEIAGRQAQNDKLDDLSKNDNFDYYTHISIGVTYHIQSIFNSSGGRKPTFNRRAPGRLPMRRRR